MSAKKRPGRSKAVLLALALLLLIGVGGLLVAKQAFTGFGIHRSKMALQKDLVVEEAKLRYSLGYDSEMYCRFRTAAESIEEVFDPSRVDASEFQSSSHRFGESWFKSDWWDPDQHDLKGGEVELDGNYLRVGHKKNEDGTLTVYLFWFTV